MFSLLQLFTVFNFLGFATGVKGSRNAIDVLSKEALGKVDQWKEQIVVSLKFWK
jgi:hypothetical protein